MNERNEELKSVLSKSILFYEAQMSGKLPSWHQVEWRKDSCLTDGNDLGLDLSGGFFDAGDYVKFNYPLSLSLQVLAWSAIEFRQGYKRFFVNFKLKMPF